MSGTKCPLAAKCPLEMYTNNEISAQLQRQSSMAIGIVGNVSGDSLGLFAKQMLI